VSETVKSITTSQPHPILAVLAGAETGIALADKLSAALGTRANGPETTSVRLNK
jgi:hypothetical protein